MKPTINLKIYNETDEVIAEFETSRVRWGFFEDVIEMTERMEDESNSNHLKMMGEMIQKLFPDLTDELLRMADFVDIKNCFLQIQNIAKQIDGSGSKNV